MKLYPVVFRTFFLVLSLSGIVGSFAHAKTERMVLPKEVTPLNYQISLQPDLEKLKFEGQVVVDLQVNQATSVIQLNAAELAFKKVDLISEGSPGVSPKTTFNEDQETVSLLFPKILKPGKYVLKIDYTGTINKSASGLFALDYGDEKNSKRALFTQFENSDARRMFPCWDEPGIKATFQLSATVPVKDRVIGNTPLLAEKPASKGFKTVQFALTPKMSTYLLFFGSGDFERITRKVNGIEIGIVVRRGETEKAKYALDAASQILPFYEEYFGVKYPLPKLDLIGAPGASQTFSAMENWGAILYFDRVLLVDPAISTEADRREVYLVIAHEMAHQWFGDLVTMEWWDALWLNEGFATWMEATVTDHFHPEWNTWIHMQNFTDDAMSLDSKAGTHPIIQTIEDVFQAAEAFDAITYKKGSAVIRMLESHVGENVFRAGVRSYMKKYAYGNTVTDQLWQEIDSFAPQSITPIAHDFTLQAGIPLIDIKRSGPAWKLEQNLFAIDDSIPATRSWHVPVDAQTLNEKKPWQGEVSRDTPAMIDDPEKHGILLNLKQSSYYRSRYDLEAFNILTKNFKALSPTAQFALIGDTIALGYAGYQPVSYFLSLFDQIEPDLNRLVLARFVNQLSELDYFFNDLPQQKEFRSYGRKKLKPILKLLTWTTQKNDDPNTAELRASVLSALGLFEDSEVIEQGNRYFDDFLKNPKTLPAELRRSVLRIVAQQADAKRWQELYELALHTSSVLERQEYYDLLTWSKNSLVAEKALQLVLDKKTPATMGPELIKGVSYRFPKMAFDFARSHSSWLTENLEATARFQFIPKIVSDSYDRSLILELKRYAKKYIPPTAYQSVQKTVAKIKYNADIREKRLPEIDTWLRRSVARDSLSR